MIYLPKHFTAKELVDPATHARFGEESFRFFRPELLESLDRIREFFNAAVTVNDWHLDGPHHWRGLRTLDCTVGAKLSAHRVGAGVDFTVAGIAPDAVRAAMLANPSAFPLIRRVEANTPSWTHADVLETWERDSSGAVHEDSAIILFNNPEATDGTHPA